MTSLEELSRKSRLIYLKIVLPSKISTFWF